MFKKGEAVQLRDEPSVYVKGQIKQHGKIVKDANGIIKWVDFKFLHRLVSLMSLTAFSTQKHTFQAKRCQEYKDKNL